jgi:multidrug efflux pump subunit AcrB
MDRTVRRLEAIARQQGDVEGISVIAGGSVFGRSQREQASRSTIAIQLVPVGSRSRSVVQWVSAFQHAVAEAELAGVRVQARPAGIRGVRVARSDEEVGVRVRGPDLGTLAAIGEALVERLRAVPGIRNLDHSADEMQQEFAVRPDRTRAAEMGVDVAQLGRALQVALDGLVVSEYLEGDRAYDVRLRLPPPTGGPQALESVLLFAADNGRPAVHLRDVAQVELISALTEIRREGQARIVEVTASLTGTHSLGAVMRAVRAELAGYELPAGYSLYTSGAFESLQRGQVQVAALAALALFLVFVVMAVQYESLRNPAVIMLGVPFALIGVVGGLYLTALPLSMPVWLGIIMLIGVVVNNSIVLVEFIELERQQGRSLLEATVEAARLRLRPILMTAFAFVIGLMPLVFDSGAGANARRSLGTIVVGGLALATVLIIFVPIFYYVIERLREGGLRHAEPAAVPAAADD